MTEPEQTIERGDIRLERSPRGTLLVWRRNLLYTAPVLVILPSDLPDLIDAASAALGDETVCVRKKELRWELAKAYWDGNHHYWLLKQPDETAMVAEAVERLTGAPGRY